MAANLKVLVLSVLTSIYISGIFLSRTEASNNGEISFSADLIHRDSPLSPLYNPKETYFIRLEKALHHSISRMSSFDKYISNQLPQPSVIPTGGQFLLNISVGTPPIQTLGIADTGSDLTWTQCAPCVGCYMQDLPLFKPYKSSTFKELSCQAKPCVDLVSVTCNNKNICNYSYGYGDGSLTLGNLATETFSFNNNNGRSTSVVVPGLAFGCGHNNTGTFGERGTGLIGLGAGHVSFISQMGPTIGWKFSYCLVPSITSMSTMHFGGAVSGPGVVKTPLIRGQDKTFYFVTLNAISVGEQKIAYNYKSSSTAEKANNSSNAIGNTFIDSGSYFTVLPTDLYNGVESALRAAIELHGRQFEGLKLCYRLKTDKGLPTMTLHFDGADVVLQPMNYFIRPDTDKSLLCLSIVSADGTTAIIGNRSQMNFFIGFDLEANTVSFLPTDCTK